MKTKLFLLAAVILLIASCKTGSFTSRRYMSGHYKSNHANVKRTDVQEVANNSKKAPLSYSGTDNLNPRPESTDDGLIASGEPKKSVFSEKKHKRLNDLSASPSKKSLRVFSLVKGMFKKPAESELKSGKSDEKISNKSLIGFACGVGAIAIDIICFIAAIGSLSYAPLAGLLVGLALGILGIVFGTQGIKGYKSSRHTPSLVFGIIGAATGLAGIILAVYFAIYGAALVFAYSI